MTLSFAADSGVASRAKELRHVILRLNKIWKVLLAFLQSDGCERLYGAAPRGPLERDISRRLGEQEATS